MRCLLLVSVFWASVALAVDPFAAAFPAPDAMVLDGDLTDWNPGRFSVSPPVVMVDGTGFVEQGTIASNADHSARVYFASAKQGLWVGALLWDDAVVVVRGEDLWKGDSFELLFPRSDGALLHLGTNPAGDVHLFSGGKAVGAAPMRAAAQRHEKGWSVELLVPWSVLGLRGSPRELKLNVGLRDADPEETPTAYRVWSGHRHSQAASAGTLEFKALPPPPVWPKCAPWSDSVTVRAPLTAVGTTLKAGDTPVVLRLLNFQSSRRNWVSLWTHFDLKQIQKDLDAASRLRANAIRLFVFFEAFGGEAVRPEMLARLHAVVREAAARGMVSVVSFFPFKKEFRVEWWKRMQTHLETIVSSFRGDPAIAMWDLMNEPDHVWAQADAGVTAQDVDAWARAAAAAVRAADPTHLLTVGLAGHFLRQQPISAVEALDWVDVVSVHWYGADEAMRPSFDRLSQFSGKPVVLQEFGMTSLYFAEAEAAKYIESVCREAQREHFSGVGVWELLDHPVGSIDHLAPRWEETPENDFGLLRSDGSPKLQSGAFCNCLSAPRLRVSPPQPPQRQ